MGVRRQWKVLKLSQVEMDSDTRVKLIEAITRKKDIQVTLYAWDVDPLQQVAREAFFTEQAAIKDWFLQKRLWEADTPPPGVTLRKWAIGVDDIMGNIHNMKLRNIPLSLNAEIRVGIIPSSLYEDLQRSLKKQS